MYKLLTVFILAATNILLAQSSPDTTRASSPTRFHSIGFNVSSVSGIGLCYRNKPTPRDLYQITGGVLTSDGRTNFSAGIEYQYQLSKSPTFRYYLAAGAGLYSDVQSKGFAGFGIGLELPAVGTTIFEGVTFGGCLFYPVFDLNNNLRISIGASVYAFYNF
jgi:hypothetical protein